MSHADVYVHPRSRVPVKTGSPVHTGQIGFTAAGAQAPAACFCFFDRINKIYEITSKAF